MGVGFPPELGLFEQNIRLRPSENRFSDGLFLLRMNEFDTRRKVPQAYKRGRYAGDVFPPL
ncbi:hypothetical protein [Neisseria elongata]|uniref:hypothetical protein n=1 Tax=Neisseria elongata TaxID=495 RepID=UPI000A89594C|nr:hypothetical protein [Neisseria elongata]